MAQNIMEELTSQIDKITFENGAERGSGYFQEIVEKTCCNNRRRVECREHFLTPALMGIIHENLKSNDDEKIHGVLYLIALLGKYESSRHFLCNAYMTGLLLNTLKNKNGEILFQTCRALGNICYDNAKGQFLITDQGGLSLIVDLLGQCNVPKSPVNNQKFKEVIVGLVLNLIADNLTVQQQVAEKDVLQHLVKFLKHDLQQRDISIISQNVFFLFVSFMESMPVEMIFNEEVCHLAVDLFKKSYGPEFFLSDLEFLEDTELPNSVKFHFAKAGLFEVLIDTFESKPMIMTEEQKGKYDMLGRVMANILSGGKERLREQNKELISRSLQKPESILTLLTPLYLSYEAMEYLYDHNDNQVLSHFVSWLSSNDKDLIHTAVLCIGNIARTDRHSLSIVEKKIHYHLLNIIEANKNDVKILYATVSTLRNLCIPTINKIILVSDGLVEVLLPLLELEVKTSSPVIFKLIGALRQLIDGQENVTLRLGRDQKLITQLVKWSSSTLHPWVSSECSRFLCWLVNISKDRHVILNILQGGGYPQILRMLGALHRLMQSEAITTITITALEALQEARRAEITDEEEKEKSQKLVHFDSTLLEGCIGEKLRHLVLQHGPKMDDHILEDFLSLLEVISKFERIKYHLVQKGFKSIVRSAFRSREDYQKFRTRIQMLEASL